MVLMVAVCCSVGAEQTGTVVGTVVDVEGASIGGASILLAEQPESGVQYKATTTRTGEFELHDVAPGALLRA